MLFKPSKLIILFIITTYAIGCGKSEYKYATINPKCGPQSLQYVMELMGIQSSTEELCALANYNEKSGTDMFGLYKAAEKKGLVPEAVRFDLEKLCSEKYPSIVFVDGGHFIVFIGCMEDSVSIFEPPDNPKIISKREFKNRWKGETLLLNRPTTRNKNPDKKAVITKTDGPHIEFEEPGIYLGALESGTKIKHDFVFKNTGTDTLKILALRSRCSCLDPLPNDRIIPPGGKGKISLEYNTKGKNRGRDEQNATVMTNDPINKVTRLSIEAVILSEVKVLPDKLDIGEVFCNQKIRKVIQIKDSGSGALKVESVKTPDCIKAEIQKGEADVNGIITVPITLDISTDSSPGMFEQNITVMTNNKIKPEFIIPISGQIISKISADPSRIVFGKIKRGSEHIKEIIVSSKTDEEFKDIKIKTGKFMTAKFENPEGSTYKIMVKFHAPETADVIDEKIDLFMENNDNPVLSVPVYAKIID